MNKNSPNFPTRQINHNIQLYTQSVLDLGFKCQSYFIHNKAKWRVIAGLLQGTSTQLWMK